MSESNVKEIRKQLRNVVQEFLQEDLIKSVEKELMAHIDLRLDAIMGHMNTVLQGVEKRSKEVLSGIIRSTPPILTPHIKP